MGIRRRSRSWAAWRLILAIAVAAGGAQRAGGADRSRAQLLKDAQLPAISELPEPPGDALALPDDAGLKDAIEIRLSQASSATPSMRRVSRNDGRLYLEVYDSAPLGGSAEVRCGGRQIGARAVKGSLWLAVKPQIGTLSVIVSGPDATPPTRFSVPATLVEVRGRQIFVNGEPFLIKGATGRVTDQRLADYVHGLGLNTLRGLNSADCRQFGFMNIASLNFGSAAPTKAMAAVDAQFEQTINQAIQWLKERVGEPVDSPNTLILQLGNERTGGMDAPGVKPLTKVRRHASQLLAAVRNYVKPLCPMLPVGYANQDLGFLTPDCMDVYMHNSFLDKDRYGYAWDDFLRWQGCLPPDGQSGQGRPFVNSEFGANRYLCQAYLEGPNNPFLEKLHEWNLGCRWAEFMEHGTAGGCIYRLDDLARPVDQGCSCFGIMTHDLKPKLACWEVAHMWRDFEVEDHGTQLLVSFKRDYWARDCRLTLTPADGGEPKTVQLEDFAPHSKRVIDRSALPVSDRTKGFRWHLAFSTHSGLPNRAAGACPDELERSDFLESLKGRDTYPFLKELFDTRVLRTNGQPAPRTLAEMTGKDGIIPVALRKPSGVTYLLLITREKDDAAGPIRSGVTIDVAFEGKVQKVDDMSGQPTGDAVEAVALKDGGQQLRNVEAARIPGAIGQRSKVPFKLPVYRITPTKYSN